MNKLSQGLWLKLVISSGFVWLLLSLWPDKNMSNQFLSASQLLSLEDHSKVTMQIGGHKLVAELVNTNASRTQGLSGRSVIGADAILFVFPRKDRLIFWMKDMQFNLDFLWVDDGKIKDITLNVPFPEKPEPVNLPIYQPVVPVNMVVELPAGTVAAKQLEIGQQVEFLAH